MMRFDEFRAKQQEADPELDRLSHDTIGACIEVHRELGPGIKEGLYGNALCRELELRGIPYEREVVVEVHYKGAVIGTTRIDLIVAGKIVVELKACESLTEIHRSQLICYLHLTGLTLGLLVNFNVSILVDGVKRVVRSKAN